MLGLLPELVPNKGETDLAATAYVNALGIRCSDSGEIRHVFAEVPPCAELPCALYQATQPLRWVIELPAGSVARLGLEEGDQLDMSALPPTPPMH